MKQRKKRLNKVLSLLLTLSMLLSMLVIPAAAADPISDYPDDLDAIVELLSGADGVDGESAFGLSRHRFPGLADHRRPLAELCDQ